MKWVLAEVVAVLMVSIAASGSGVPGVGMTTPFPKAVQVGAKVDFQLWQWGDQPADRKEILKLKNGMRISWQSLPAKGIHFKFRILAPHDSAQCEALSSDSFDRIAWGPEKAPVEGSAQRLYRAYPEWNFTPPQVGKYCLSVQATMQGKIVAKSVIHFQIVNAAPPPRNTHYMAGKRDCKGNPITTSRPVNLGGLNETPVLKDNDYPFEPQHAYNVVNFERFPPFSLPPRFIAVWNSRRFTDENRFGGPLNRGFTSMATVISSQDNLPISQRTWFHTPDLQVMFINKWYHDDPVKYADLKGYADYRSAFVSPENAFKLGWACYSAWGAGGYAPFDAGIYGFDEEQMWPTIGAKLLKEHPDLVPAELRSLRVNDPNLVHPDTLAKMNDAYVKAWGDFIGNYYRGARAAAASRGRVFKVWHYGSHAPGESLFRSPDDNKIDPATGKYRVEELDDLFPWFKTGKKVDFNASLYSQEIDYFNKDFYYWTIFPQKSSMYEKDAQGKYALDKNGRRIVRKDLFKERMYVDPAPIGYEDPEVSPTFLKAFIDKGENALFWMNGGKYYKQHGTLITNKGMIPTLRPGNQETWGESAKLGSRPISPYMAEASVIYTYMMGLEGIYLWDARGFTGPVGYGPNGSSTQTDTLGDIEFMIKGMHRISQFDRLFEGKYDYIRPIRYYNVWNRDHPIIRGILNGRYLLLAMTNPYLDPGETQKVEVRYGSPFGSAKKPIWSGEVTILARKTRLSQCKLPALPGGKAYDPDHLYFRYTCVDGRFRKTFMTTGDYEIPYHG
ncbi:MAG TPA: hypothetical protein VFJ58_05760 [Armatimonadota bacterium]|nr:hypothetical protein [Armatimonadota bacterium]